MIKQLNGLRIENVPFSKRRRETKDIYFSSFSKKERLPFWTMNAMSIWWSTKFWNFYDGDTLCGFIYLAHIGKQVFIMFFAVEEKLRSQGYGKKILEAVKMQFPKSKIIVSIKPCDEAAADNAIRIRRKNFYLNCGFKESGYMINIGATEEILIANGVFNKKAFQLFWGLYSKLLLWPKIYKKSI